MAIKPDINRESNTIKRISRQGKEHRWFALFEKVDAVFQFTLLPGIEKLCALRWVAGGARVKLPRRLPMAFSEALAQRIRQRLARKKGIEEKKMFGGIGFLLSRQHARGRSKGVAACPPRPGRK
jgi:hypothetical protein